MSLINDALKRAKQVQQPAAVPVSQGPQFRSAEPARCGARPAVPWMSAALFALLGAMGLLGLVLGWQWMRTEPGRTTKTASASERALIPAQPQTKVPPTPARRPAAAAVPAAVPSQVVAQKPVAKAGPAAPLLPKAAPASTVPKSPASAPPPAAAVLASVSPPPAPLKLQAIFYQPNRPSAIISGQTVHVGERIGGWRVLAINRSSATLGGAGQTNVLSLGPQM